MDLSEPVKALSMVSLPLYRAIAFDNTEAVVKPEQCLPGACEGHEYGDKASTNALHRR